MHSLIEEINQYKYLNCEIIYAKDLKLIVEVAAASLGPVHDQNIFGVKFEDVREIGVTENSPRYRVTFDNFIAFHVGNEGMDSGPAGEFQGLGFRVYKDSSYLKYFAERSYFGEKILFELYKPVHVGIYTLNEIIDVIGQGMPEISKIEMVR